MAFFLIYEFLNALTGLNLSSSSIILFLNLTQNLTNLIFFKIIIIVFILLISFFLSFRKILDLKKLIYCTHIVSIIFFVYLNYNFNNNTSDSYESLAFNNNHEITQKLKSNKNKKLYFLLFDELDRGILLSHINNPLLNNYKNLLNNSVIHNNVYSSSSSTLNVMAEILNGKKIKDIKKIDKNIYLFNDFQNNNYKLNYENSFFNNLKSNKIRIGVVSGALRYCSLWFKSNNFDYCFESRSQINKKELKYLEGIKFYFLSHIKFINNFLYPVKINTTNLEVKNSIKYYDNSEKITDLEIDELIDLELEFNLFHFLLPHLNATDKPNLTNSFFDINEDTNNSYLSNVVYSDLVLNKLTEKIAIKNKNLSDVMIIVLSDHGYRKGPNNLKNVFFSARILGDDYGYNIKNYKKFYLKDLYKIIYYFFDDKIETNEDIFNSIKNISH